MEQRPVQRSKLRGVLLTFLITLTIYWKNIIIQNSNNKCYEDIKDYKILKKVITEFLLFSMFFSVILTNKSHKIVYVNYSYYKYNCFN